MREQRGVQREPAQRYSEPGVFVDSHAHGRRVRPRGEGGADVIVGVEPEPRPAVHRAARLRQGDRAHDGKVRGDGYFVSV